MNNKSYKQQVIQAAIDGLVQGGFNKDFAQNFYLMFERIYECGYNECRRELVDQYSKQIKKEKE